MPGDRRIGTRISRVRPQDIELRGFDLCRDILGKVSFGDAIFITLVSRKPTRSESAMFNAILTTGIDHGMTPSAIVARLINDSAPEAFQAALGGGILALGDRLGGVIERSAKMLQEATTEMQDEHKTARKVAEEIVAEYASKGLKIPGLGHAVHKESDPRTTRLFEIAKAQGITGDHEKVMRAVATEASHKFGVHLPINVDGAIAVIVSEMGFHWSLGKAFFCIGRTAGLAAHLMEEKQDHAAPLILLNAEKDNASEPGGPKRRPGRVSKVG